MAAVTRHTHTRARTRQRRVQAPKRARVIGCEVTSHRYAFRYHVTRHVRADWRDQERESEQ